MARINRYDPPAMKRTADAISNELKSFQAAKDAVDELITALSISWKDNVNIKYSNSYLLVAKPKAEELDRLIQQYTSLMYQCSTRFGSAIDSGNSYLTGF